jgi:flagellar basal body-associated protein FliL
MKYTAIRIRRVVLRLTTRFEERLEEAARQPDRGDISITTVIIWVAAVTGALVIAGTIAVVIAKYNTNLSNT